MPDSLTLRQQAALAILAQVVTSRPELPAATRTTRRRVAAQAVALADALIEELNAAPSAK